MKCLWLDGGNFDVSPNRALCCIIFHIRETENQFQYFVIVYISVAHEGCDIAANISDVSSNIRNTEEAV